MGAQRRLEELRQEEAAIRAAFPDLDAPGGAGGRGRRGRPRKTAPASAAGDSAPTAAAQGARGRRRRPAMNAAQRKAVSERMKKYWAARRKAKG
jgi:hypothetical protein